MKKEYPIFQIDAFTDSLFSGNPAAVVVLDEWIENVLMQKIAMENNLSETAFIVPRKDFFDITWFTPMSEIDLCGHATLSAAHVIFNHLNYERDIIQFKTREVGDLYVRNHKGILYLDFPSRPSERLDTAPPIVIEGLGGQTPDECYVSRDYMLVYKDSSVIRTITPDFKRLSQADKWVCITAPGSKDDECDFVSRMFCAGDGIEEDPVTGSTHCNLIPYWSNRLGKKNLLAKQLSSRGGILYCELKDDRVEIGGKSKTFMKGSIYLEL
jgi:predicted PhzF superfamily epimerase YddE/YHI9